MKIRTLICSAALALAAFTLPAANPASPTHFQVKVLDAAGQPVAGALVERYTDAEVLPGMASDDSVRLEERRTTDGTGIVAFTLTNRTGLAVVASKAGLSVAWVTYFPVFSRALGGAELDNQVFELTLSPPQSVSGIVRDPAGKPAGDALVFVSSVTLADQQRAAGRGALLGFLPPPLARQRFNARTDAEGKFRIQELPADATCELAARKPGLALEAPPVNVLEQETLSFHAGQSNVVLTLTPASAVEGRVVQEDNGARVVGARVSILQNQQFGYGFVWGSTTSGVDGSFRLSEVPAGDYLLRASETNPIPAWVGDTADVTLEAGKTNRDVKLTTGRGGVIEVTVRDAANGQPIPGASVLTIPRGEQGITATTTSDQGVGWLRLAAAQYTLGVMAEGYKVYDSPFTVEAGQTNQLAATLEAAPQFKATVLDSTGKPAARIPLSVPFTQFTARTDGEGRATLDGTALSTGPQQGPILLMARDFTRNLAAASELDPEATNNVLRLEPGLVLAGRITDMQGKTVTNGTATLMFHTVRMSASFGAPAQVDGQGKFEIKALPLSQHYSVTVSAPGFGRKFHDLPVEDTGGQRVDLGASELPVADQRIAGVVLDSDDKPVAGASVGSVGSLNDPQPQLQARADVKGRFAFDHVCAGPIQLSARIQRGMALSFGNVTAEAGDTNITIQLRENGSVNYPSPSAARLSGIVTDPDGKPAPKASVELFPFNEGEKRTDAEGRYKLSFDPNRFGNSANQRVLVARDVARNLAAALDVDPEATNADIRLEPAVTLSGRVLNAQGKAIANAEATVMFRAGNYSSLLGQPVRADANGRFEISALPAERRYAVNVSASGFGRENVNVDTAEASTNSSGARVLQLQPVELLVADQRIAGVVLDANDKPVSQASVNVSGPKQPSLNAQTDSKGRFSFKNVCAAPIELFAYSRTGNDYSSLRVEPGDTNITLQLRAPSSGRVESRPVSLKGKPLPDLTALGLSAADAPAGQPTIVLLIDAEQRPSRRMLKVLTDQAAALKDKHVAVIILQASAMADAAYAAWLQDAALPFPIARLKDTSEKGHAAWGAAALPWLILADKTHRVAAEGFATEELEAKLNELAK